MNIMSIFNHLATWMWVFLALIVYAYVGYPMVIWALSRLLGKRPECADLAEEDLPYISLLIAAYNEEDEIGSRVQNALAMDYPREKLQVVIGSDGSTDATTEIVSMYAGQGVKLLDFEERRGKAAVLNAAVPGLDGEIVLFSDANTYNDPMAARKLVRWFRDPEVGAVCGRLILTDPETGRNADSLYWKYESFLKRCEGRMGAILGANGGIYAIRKELFAPIPADTILDDFVIPLRAKLREGCAIVYDYDAIAREETPANVKAEFHRRTRIGAGGFQCIGMLWRLLDPRRGWVAFSFLSHKILRWLCPFFMIGLVASNLLLVSSERPVYGYVLFGQACFYLGSALSAYIPSGKKVLKPLRLAAMFTSMNVALMFGFWRWLLGSQKGVWRRTPRLTEAEKAV